VQSIQSQKAKREVVEASDQMEEGDPKEDQQQPFTVLAIEPLFSFNRR